MITYLKQLADALHIAQQNQLGEGLQKIHGHDVPDIFSLLAVFSEELEKLNTEDFEPSARFDFAILRLAIRKSAEGRIGNGRKAAEDALKLKTILDSYTGKGSGAVVRQFPHITNLDVKKLVERDYSELTQRAFPDGSWKSTVILSGSILEAVLYDRLTKDPSAIAAAMGSPDAPKYKGVVKDITKHDYQNEWKLNDLIKVACDLKILPHKDEQAIHQVLREYRNLVHPLAEIAMGVFINESHATASKGMLDVCLDHIK